MLLSPKPSSGTIAVARHASSHHPLTPINVRPSAAASLANQSFLMTTLVNRVPQVYRRGFAYLVYVLKPAGTIYLIDFSRLWPLFIGVRWDRLIAKDGEDDGTIGDELGLVGPLAH